MKTKEKYVCQECFGARDIYNGEEYIKCTTCEGEGETILAKNQAFLLSIQIIEEDSIEI